MFNVRSKQYPEKNRSFIDILGAVTYRTGMKSWGDFTISKELLEDEIEFLLVDLRNDGIPQEAQAVEKKPASKTKTSKAK